MTIDIEPDIRVTVRGDLGDQSPELARQRVVKACAHLREPVLFAEIKLHHEPDPARERPYLAEATLTLASGTLRAQVATAAAATAVDLLGDRLSRRISRHNTRLMDRHHQVETPRPPDDHEWRHGDRPAQRPEHFDRPVDDREVVRRKTFAVGAMTPDEAADVLDLLGHDFLLFTNLNTGADAVLSYDGDTLDLIDASGRPDAVGDATIAPVRIGPNAVRHCSGDEAAQELDLDLEPFVFFLDPDVGRGQVLYRRYDGNYGEITPA